MEYIVFILIGLGILLGPWIGLLIQSSKVKTLSRRVDELQGFVYGHLRQSPKPEVPTPTPVPPTEFSQQSSPNEVLSTPVLSPKVSQQSSPNEVLSTPVLPPKVSQRSSNEWEMFIGGKLLNRIGAIAIAIGALFFLKYAFDENWITETMRVGIGLLTGATMLVLAARFHKKDMVVFAQGLIGAGLPILYLSVWSTYSYYDLLPHTIAFSCMALVTVVAAWHAIRYRSLFIGLMTVIGGMLTPILLSTGVMNTVGLFTYLALLDLGLFAMVVVWKMWKTIAWATMFSTLLWWVIWIAEMSTSQIIADFPAPIFFALLFIGLFVAFDVYAHRDDRGSDELGQRMGMTVVLLGLSSVLYAVLDSFAIVSWITAFGIETLILTAAVVALHRISAEASRMKSMYSVFVVLCFALVPAHDDISTVEVAFFRGLIVALCAFSFRPISSLAPSVTGSIIAIVSFGMLFAQESAWSMDQSYVYNLPWNGLPFALVACGIGMYTCGYFLHSTVGKELVALKATLRVVGWLTLSVTAAKLAFDASYNWLYADTASAIEWQLYVSGVSSVMAAAIVGLTLRNIGELRSGLSASIAGALTMFVSVIVWLFVAVPFAPDSHYSFALNIRVATALLLIVGLYFSMRNTRLVDTINASIWKISFWLCIGLVSFVLLSAEAIWPLTIDMRSAYDQDAPNVASDILDKVHLVLSSVWIVYSILVVAIGFWRRRRAVRITGIALLGISILKIFLYDLSYLEQPYRIVSFIALGVILLLASYVYQRYKHIITT